MWLRKKERKPKNSGHFVPQQCLRAAHALRSDQNSGHFVPLQRLRAAYTLRSDQNWPQRNYLNLLLHILIPDSLVAGICRAGGAQPQWDHPGQQQGDSVELCLNKYEDLLKTNDFQNRSEISNLFFDGKFSTILHHILHHPQQTWAELGLHS